MTARETATHLQRQGAHLVVGVLTRLATCRGRYRGKVNLGNIVGARGDNSRCARPVESAVRLGLINQQRDGAAYTYAATRFGRRVLRYYRGEAS